MAKRQRPRRSRPPAPATPPRSGEPAFLISIEPDYRGHRIGVGAQLIAGQWLVEVRIRRILSDTKPVVLNFRWPASVPDPDRRGMRLGKTWVKQNAPNV